MIILIDKDFFDIPYQILWVASYTKYMVEPFFFLCMSLAFFYFADFKYIPKKKKRIVFAEINDSNLISVANASAFEFSCENS